MVDFPNILYHDLSTDAGTRPPREDDDDVVVEAAADELFCRRQDSIVVADDVHDDEVVADGRSRPFRMTPIREAFRRTAIELLNMLLSSYLMTTTTTSGRLHGPLGVGWRK